MIKHLDELVAKARERGRRRIAVAYAQDAHTLDALNDAYESGLV